MALAFQLLAGLALAAAVVSWGVAVMVARQVLAARRREGLANGPGAFALLVLWPFAVRRHPLDEGPEAVRASKATIAFFVALTVAAAAISASTNLTHKRVSAGAVGPIAGALPSKS